MWERFVWRVGYRVAALVLFSVVSAVMFGPIAWLIHRESTRGDAAGGERIREGGTYMLAPVPVPIRVLDIGLRSFEYERIDRPGETNPRWQYQCGRPPRLVRVEPEDWQRKQEREAEQRRAEAELEEAVSRAAPRSGLRGSTKDKT